MALIVSQHFRWPFFVIFQKFLNFPLVSVNDKKNIINLQVDAMEFVNLKLTLGCQDYYLGCGILQEFEIAF